MTALPPTYDFDVLQPISTDLAVYGGVFAKRHVIPRAGTYVPQHAHAYDHLTLVTAGVMRAWSDGALVGEFTAPAEIRIPAHAKHTFVALVDGTTFYCLHNADRFDETDRHELPGSPCTGCQGCAPEPTPAPDADGFVIAQEPFATFLRDGGPIMDEHLAAVGEAPGAWREKNLPLMQRLADTGGLHVTTARSNGRVFGYILAIIAPTLYSAKRTEALHTAFFVSRDAPGLGVKLQRASIAFLRSIGVTEVLFRAGTKGAGPRLGTLYRRLGAVPAGEMFFLDLEAA